MPKGEKPTENEHFVPRMYLKCFSEITEALKRLQFDCESISYTLLRRNLP